MMNHGSGSRIQFIQILYKYTINEYLKFLDTKSYSNVLCHILVVVLAIQTYQKLQARHPSHSRRFWMQYSERKWPKPFGPWRGFSGEPTGGSPTTGHEKHTGVFRGHEIGGIVWYSTTMYYTYSHGENENIEIVGHCRWYIGVYALVLLASYHDGMLTYPT